MDSVLTHNMDSLSTDNVSKSDAESRDPHNTADSGETAAAAVAKKDVFRIDRALIEEVQQDAQAAELQSLGLSVYNQDTLEQGILSQVDAALAHQERQHERARLDKQIKSVQENIRSAEQRLQQEDVLSRVMRAGPVSVASALGARKEQQRRKEELVGLHAKQRELAAKRTALEDEQAEGSATGGDMAEGSETQQERLIRLGEMTPFGTVLTSQQSSSSEAKLTDFEKYLQSQAALEKARSKPSSSHRPHTKPSSTATSKGPASSSSEVPSSSTSGVPARTKSALKTSVLIPRKRKKKEVLGTKTRREPRGGFGAAGSVAAEEQTMWLDEDDPDYMPSEEEQDDFYMAGNKRRAEPRASNRSRQRVSEEEWGTDDSDWESSGDEDRVVRKRKAGRELDDGNSADYIARVKLWEREEGGDSEPSVHQLEGGLEVPTTIWSRLYKYQRVGVQWMWELYHNGTGGILGDEMGLGKTIQIIAFLAGLQVSRLRDKHTAFRGLGASLIVCPTTVMHQWVRELHVWWPPLRVAILHDSGSFAGSRTQLIREMAQSGGLLVTSYQGLVKHQQALLVRSWHLVILDEGHKIRNPDAQATLAAKSIPTPHRLALTGSPMQNNLRELWSLVDFVYPGKLGTLPDFLAGFAVPITQGGYANASEVQVATAYQCALSLKETIKPYLLRRMKNDVKSHIQLPGKNEQVLFCRLTEEQRAIYRRYVDSRLVSNIMEGKTQIFVGLINLRKICNHPDLFSGRSKLTQDDTSLPPAERYGHWELSGKMLVVRSLLKIWQRQGHRVLLFTQGRQMLCILEYFLQQEGYKYLKLDGSTSVGARQPLIAEFNTNPEHFVFLLTTRVGGLGVNLTGADRVVIFDPDWNPATDTQARERAWRIGQQNQVTIYRLVTAGTIEEKIYHRQIFKQFLTNKVLKDPRQRRFFKTNDLYELFTLKDDGDEHGTETSAIFAGTGSEVRVPRRPRAPSPQPVVPAKIQFSEEKIRSMKLLAQRLSRQMATKMASKPEEEDTSKNRENKTGREKEGDSKTAVEPEGTREKSTSHSNGQSIGQVREAKTAQKTDSSDPRKRSGVVAVRREEEEAGPSSGRKRKRRGAKFEGERVSHLARCKDYAELLGSQQEDKEGRKESQDEYVLRKLFKKSGLQTALRHDRIMEGGGSDVALVEREARHVAQEAVARLKESQQRCFGAAAGVPTWTGTHGHVRNTVKKREERRKAKKAAAAAAAAAAEAAGEAPVEDEELISGEDLLDLWRRQDRLLKPPSPVRPPEPPEPPSPSEDVDMLDDEDSEELPDERLPMVEDPPAPTPRRSSILVTPEEEELLRDVKAFLSFGGEEPGRASTGELLARFPNSRLPPEQAPLFRELLHTLAEFSRDGSGAGIWRLRDEFK